MLLSCELVVAIRLLRMAGVTDELPPPLARAYRAVAHLPTEMADRDLGGDLELADSALASLRLDPRP